MIMNNHYQMGWRGQWRKLPPWLWKQTPPAILTIGHSPDETDNLSNKKKQRKGLAVCFPYVTEWRVLTMTSSNGNILRVTGPLCGEFTGHRWIHRTKDECGTLMFSLICAWIYGWINNSEAGDLIRHRAHYDVSVMCVFRYINIRVEFKNITPHLPVSSRV